MVCHLQMQMRCVPLCPNSCRQPCSPLTALPKAGLLPLSEELLALLLLWGVGATHPVLFNHSKSVPAGLPGGHRQLHKRKKRAGVSRRWQARVRGLTRRSVASF